MRNQPIEPWEVEAARRRELVKADFGGRHAKRPDNASQMVATDDRGRLFRLVSALRPAPGPTASRRIERSSACHPRAGAIEPGSS